jgi:RNA polymerase sigma factor (sigma-70 family)
VRRLGGPSDTPDEAGQGLLDVIETTGALSQNVASAHAAAPLADIVRAARAGDERAFADLVSRFQDIAVAYATSLLGDYHLAEDAAQNAFADAYRLLASLREPAAFGGWLRTIVFKHCDRERRARQLPLAGLDAALAVASSDPSPLDALVSAEHSAALRDAIAGLTEAEQQVVLLYYMGGHTQTEIANFLGTTPNAVKTRLYSARRRLRAHMSDIERRLGAARPSEDDEFAERVRRMIQPDELKKKEPWLWSPGMGTDVWEMFIACSVGDLEKVKKLLARDPSLLRCHFEYRTPLSFAVRENQLAVAELLLDMGAAKVFLGDPLEMARDRDYAEMTALLESKAASLHGMSTRGEPVAAATREYDLARVRALLDADPDLVSAADHSSNQPIHWATMTRQLDVIDELLKRGADIDAKRLDGARPIHLTNGDYGYRGWRDVPDHVTTKPRQVYDHLVARGANVDIWMACVTGDLARARALLDQNPRLVNRPNDYNSYYAGCGTPLKNAAMAGHIDIVRLLLNRGADPNLPEEGIAPQGHALYSAVYHKHYEIAKLLLEHHAYPNPVVESSADAVWIAIRNGDLRTLELLASHGAVMDIPLGLEGDVTYDDIVRSGVGRPLKILAFYGDLAEAERVLAADPSLADEPEALRNAATSGHEAIVRLLLRYQPKLAQRVTISRPRAMAELLFAHGMDANRPNWLRSTPLHHFAKDGDIESAGLFLDHGADLHARDEEGRSTPLAWAARAGQRRMVEFLLRRGAPLQLPDDPPWATPLAWAKKRGHQEIVDVLAEAERRGAPPALREDVLDARAHDLVEVFERSDEQALGRLVEHFRIKREMTWDRRPLAERVDRLRQFVRKRLSQDAPADQKVVEHLDLPDARQFIARMEGFQSWEELLEAAKG